jgi:CBS domain-containing protein
MKISEILDEKKNEIYSVTDTVMLCDVIAELNDKNVGALMVLNSSREVAGIVSERDILKKACPKHQDSDNIPVADVMTPREQLIVGTPEDTISYAMNVMTTKKVRHLPIFRHETLLGIISIGDIVKVFLEQSEAEVEKLREHIRNPYGINAL